MPRDINKRYDLEWREHHLSGETYTRNHYHYHLITFTLCGVWSYAIQNKKDYHFIKLDSSWNWTAKDAMMHADTKVKELIENENKTKEALAK